ncbi:MAG: flagellar basal body rod protein FlgC [Nitrospirota bacterium]
MNTFIVFRVSASALEAQRQRMNVIASNMANVHSTRTEEGGPYKRKDVVFSTLTLELNPVKLEGVQVVDIAKDNTPFKMVYDPDHPDADKDGYVAMPNVNIIEEMVNMMMALRTYEASVSAFNISKAMFMKTLEIGRQ